MTETEIILGCQAFQKSAFKELVKTYSPSMMSVCIRYLGDPYLAQDMLQETFIAVFKHILQYQPTGSFKGWLHRIAATTCLKELRKRKQILLVDLDDYEELAPEENIDFLDELGIMKIISELPDQYRLVFNLYVIEGYTHREIATMLEIEERTSRVQLTRARKFVRQLFQTYNQTQNI